MSSAPKRPVVRSRTMRRMCLVSGLIVEVFAKRTIEGFTVCWGFSLMVMSAPSRRRRVHSFAFRSPNPILQIGHGRAVHALVVEIVRRNLYEHVQAIVDSVGARIQSNAGRSERVLH